MTATSGEVVTCLARSEASFQQGMVYLFLDLLVVEKVFYSTCALTPPRTSDGFE